MIEILCPKAGELEPYWPEMRRLWRQDSIRRRHRPQLEELKRSLLLGLIEIWIVWDDDPTDVTAFGGPHHCLGIVTLCLHDGRLWVQFACGRFLQKWVGPMTQTITAYATDHGVHRIRVYCRRGWKQTLRPLWSALHGDGVLTLDTDPEVLHVDAHQALCA
jgi:hypothetical protein